MRWALALLLLAGTASAKCVGKGLKEPADLEALRACQAKERQALIDTLFDKTGTLPTAAQLDSLDVKQRAEASKFLEGKTIGVSDMDLASETPVKEKTAATAAKTAAKAAGDGLKPTAGMTAEDHAMLKASLTSKSDNGKKGVTPEMAADMRKMLMEKQGSVSPDMERLLQLTARDGVNLTEETMKELRGAGKAAKAQGLDLNISPDAERQLLEDDLTPAGGQAGRGTN